MRFMHSLSDEAQSQCVKTDSQHKHMGGLVSLWDVCTFDLTQRSLIIPINIHSPVSHSPNPVLRSTIITLTTLKTIYCNVFSDYTCRWAGYEVVCQVKSNTQSSLCVSSTSARPAANGALKINDSLVKLSLELILEMHAHCLLSQY